MSDTFGLKTRKQTNSWTVFIHIAGPYSMIEQVCQRYCDSTSYCVSVSATNYIYKDGAEPGATIRLINYPRFPATPMEIEDRAIELAKLVAVKCGQDSFSIETPSVTTFYSRKADA